MIDLPQMERKREAPAAGGRPRQWFRSEVRDDGTAEIRIYDVIGGWFGVNVRQFMEVLDSIHSESIDVRINSPGGDVFDGVTIYNALKRHDARITVHVDGVAASIASIIALAGDEVVMHDGSFMMIHDPWTMAIGNAADMTRVAEVLGKVGGSLAGIYTTKTGLPRDEITTMMEEETWMTAQEAVDKGFASRTDGAKDEELERAAKWDMAAYAKAPERFRGQTSDNRGIETIRDFEDFLRDAGGFSRNAAKAIAAGGFGTPEDARDEPDGGPEDAGEPALTEVEEAIAQARVLLNISRARKTKT